MSESIAIDSLRGHTMPKSYSGDLRERVIEAVEAGASRREAAERFEISISSAVKWLRTWQEQIPVIWTRSRHVSINDHRRHHLVVAQSSHQRDRLPMSVRNVTDQSLTTR